MADTDIPILEEIKQPIKEKYEYAPILQTENIYRRPEDRVSSEVMTKFEFCEAVSIRARQIEQKNKIFTEIGHLTDPIEIAKKEIYDKKCPLSVVRVIFNNQMEKWHINEMAIPDGV